MFGHTYIITGILLCTMTPKIHLKSLLRLAILCSHDFHDSHTQSSKLLASLSGFQVTRKSWRKEAFDLFLAPDFFSTTLTSLREWKVIVDNLMTQDQVTFRDLLSRLHSTSSSGVVNIFSSLDQVGKLKRNPLLPACHL